MLHTSLRRTLEAIDRPDCGFSGSDLKRSVTKQAQSKSIELPGSHDIFLSHAREAAAFSRAKWQCWIKKAAAAK
jgi:hypothetical protein